MICRAHFGHTHPHTHIHTLNPSLTETLTIHSSETSALNGWRLSVAMSRKTPPGAWSDNFFHSWESSTFDWIERTREKSFSWHISHTHTNIHTHINIFNISSVLRSKITNFDMQVSYCWIQFERGMRCKKRPSRKSWGIYGPKNWVRIYLKNVNHQIVLKIISR